MKNATLTAVLAIAVAGGVAAAHFFGSAHGGIQRDRAIAIARIEAVGQDPAAAAIGAQSGPFRQFWYPGSTDFSAPAERRVWAVAFRGRFATSCGPPPAADEHPQCPPPNETMMVILNYADGGFIEDASPAVGFDSATSTAP
jgi:hypothetical protein